MWAVLRSSPCPAHQDARSEEGHSPPCGTGAAPRCLHGVPAPRLQHTPRPLSTPIHSPCFSWDPGAPFASRMHRALTWSGVWP